MRQGQGWCRIHYAKSEAGPIMLLHKSLVDLALNALMAATTPTTEDPSPTFSTRESRRKRCSRFNR